MRIAQIDLKAFAHFKGRRIDFDAAQGLHLTYGPNEAGKSSLSRALNAALFGFHVQSKDNFVHENKNLRVGVVLESASGERLAGMRRKAQKNSLIQYDPTTGEELGEAIPEERLAALMGGLGETLFEPMFRIDHVSLVAGGKVLAEGRGEVGQSLFAAGAGLASVKRTRERLEKGADDLFKARASTPAINREIGTYGDACRKVKECQIRPTEWEALDKQSSEAGRQYEEARSRQQALQQEARRLERLKALLPDVAGRDEALRHIAALGDVIRLSGNAPTDRAAAQAGMRGATRTLEEAQRSIVGLREQLDGIQLPERLLAEAGAIDALHFSLDAYRLARDAALDAQAALKGANARASELLADMDETMREDIRSVIPSPTARARIQSLATHGATLSSELSSLKAQLADAKRELARLVEELDSLGIETLPASLRELIAALDAQGNPEAKAEELGTEARELQAQAEREAAALAGWPVDQFIAVKPPLVSEVESFRTRKDENENRIKTLQGKIQDLENDIATVRGELEGLARGGEVPTSEQLAGERETREGLWRRVRRMAFPETFAKSNEEALESHLEYEAAVKGADSTADRRFADAARVTQHAELQKRLLQMNHVLDLEKGRLTEATAVLDESRLTWQRFLKEHGLPLLGVADIIDWLGRRDRLVQRHGDFETKSFAAKAAADQAARFRVALSEALASAGMVGCGDKETLVIAIARARNAIDQANQGAVRRTILTRNQKDVAAKADTLHEQSVAAAKTLEQWRSDWAAAMQSIRLTAEADAAEAGVRLAQFEALGKALDEIKGAKVSLEAARAVVQRFETEALRLAYAVGFEPGPKPVDAVAETLHQVLAEARAAAEQRKILAAAAQEAERLREVAAHAIEKANKDLEALMKAANCATTEELERAEQASAEIFRLENEKDGLEKKLIEGSGMPLAEFLAQAASQDLALVSAALDRIGTDLDECSRVVEDLHREKLDAENALALINGAAAAAEAGQGAAESAARLSNLVSEYSALRLASAILGDVIESYQKHHEGPLIKRASEIFSTITVGRFAKIVTDFDENVTVLLAVRPDGERKTMDGLSSGRRDQLFLALRLAAIECHVASQEPMPVILDDIVINFDDESAAATFTVLAELAKKTQVLFFTHHEHLLDKAAKILTPGVFATHRL